MIVLLCIGATDFWAETICLQKLSHSHHKCYPH